MGHAVVDNRANADTRALEDVGQASLISKTEVQCFSARNWFTPDGHAGWGERPASSQFTGTKGVIRGPQVLRLRPQRRGRHSSCWPTATGEGSPHNSLVKGRVGFPFFGQLILDVPNRTENANDLGITPFQAARLFAQRRRPSPTGTAADRRLKPHSKSLHENRTSRSHHLHHPRFHQDARWIPHKHGETLPHRIPRRADSPAWPTTSCRPRRSPLRLCRHGLTICATHEPGDWILDEPGKVRRPVESSRLPLHRLPFPLRRGLRAMPDSRASLIRKLDQAGALLRENGLVLAYHNHNHEFVKWDGKNRARTYLR